MVCDRCIKVVKEELEKLGHKIEHIELGEVLLKKAPTQKQLLQIKEVLEVNGFSLLEDSKKQTIEQIKNLIINKIHYSKDPMNTGFSKLIENKLHKDYTTLSKMFSSVENITIEHFVILQKIEKVKELLRYGELTLSEIAYKLGYNSVNHLSSQFKKHTGLTATQFKETTTLSRNPLDKVN